MKIFRKTTLYIVRTNNNGIYQNSAPCMNCFDIIVKLNIKRIIFSSENAGIKILKPHEFETTHISNGNRYLAKQRVNPPSPPNRCSSPILPTNMYSKSLGVNV